MPWHITWVCRAELNKHTQLCSPKPTESVSRLISGRNLLPRTFAGFLSLKEKYITCILSYIHMCKSCLPATSMFAYASRQGSHTSKPYTPPQETQRGCWLNTKKIG